MQGNDTYPQTEDRLRRYKRIPIYRFKNQKNYYCSRCIIIFLERNSDTDHHCTETVKKQEKLMKENKQIKSMYLLSVTLKIKKTTYTKKNPKKQYQMKAQDTKMSHHLKIATKMYS